MSKVTSHRRRTFKGALCCIVIIKKQALQQQQKRCTARLLDTFCTNLECSRYVDAWLMFRWKLFHCEGDAISRDVIQKCRRRVLQRWFSVLHLLKWSSDREVHVRWGLKRVAACVGSVLLAYGRYQVRNQRTVTGYGFVRSLSLYVHSK